MADAESRDDHNANDACHTPRDAGAVTDAFEGIAAVAGLLATFPHPWYVAGGWALDLFAGRVTRAHGDLEVAVSRSDQQALRACLAAWTWVKAAPRAGAAPGEDWEQTPWADGEWLEPPLHQVFALPPGGGAEDVIGFVLNEIADGEWAFRHNRQIRRPAGDVGLRAHRGIPITAPEIVLAHKAKYLRPKDQHDFDVSAPFLDTEQRAWLGKTLALCYPGHPWVAQFQT